MCSTNTCIMCCFMFSLGFVSNGEYNSLRSTGYSRPLSVLKLKANARSKYAQMGKTKMLKMLSPIRELSTCSLHKYSVFTNKGTATPYAL